MSSSAICSHFTQNAWKKDLCSNCFKSKDEHKPGNNLNTKLRFTSLSTTKSPTITTSAKTTATNNNNSNNAANDKNSYNNINNNNTNLITATTTTTSNNNNNNKKTDYPNKYKMPVKSIIKKAFSNSVKPLTGGKNKSQNNKVSFPKHISEVIGYGGEWSDDSFDDDDDDDADFMNLGNERVDENAATSTDDEESLELKRITIANTDFNMNNGNLLGDAQENIKRSFAALKLGAPQMDKEGKKQTLKINVVPFGCTGSNNSANLTSSLSDAEQHVKQTINVNSTKTNNGNNNNNTNTTISVKAKFEMKTDVLASVTAKSDTKSTQLEFNTSQKPTTTITTTTTTSTSKTNNNSNNNNKNKSAATKQQLEQQQEQSEKKNKNVNRNDGKNSPPVERAMEKSLLDEISETLEQNQNDAKKILQTQAEIQAQAATAKDTQAKVKFEIKSLTDTLDENNKPFLDLKKSISRNPPITKEHTKPKVNIFPKYITSDTDSNCSDTDNGVSAYYDVVEAQLSYENIPDGKEVKSAAQNQKGVADKQNNNNNNTNNKNINGDKSIYSSSQYITDMLLSSRTRAASYNLHEGNFMTSKITPDGLIVTKCNNAASDDALDSTGSSFDGSSDDETSYNMTRSESDSGIGISIGSHDYKNIAVAATEKDRKLIEKKFSASNNNSDYEDIQVIDHQQQQQQQKQQQQHKKEITGNNTKNNFSLEKCRELHGEPDGSADPDGTSIENKMSQQLPALPKSPPPTKIIDARPSFLHGLQKQHPPMLLKKPDLPAKPLVSPVNSPLKTFAMKRQVMTTPASKSNNNNNNNNNEQQQQVISQLQTMMMMSKSNEQLTTADSAKDIDSKLKKGRAPIPPAEFSPSSTLAANEQQRRTESSAPPTPERDYSIVEDFIAAEQHNNKTNNKTSVAKLEVKLTSPNAQGESAKKSLKQGSDYDKKSNETNSSLTQNNSNFNIKLNSIECSSKLFVAVKDKDKEKVEKEKRTANNPKFRSLNTFVTQRNNAAKNIQLQSATSTVKHSMTPEPTPRNASNKTLSMSEECLAANHSNNDHLKRNAPSMLPMGSTNNLLAMDYKKTTQSPLAQTKVKTKFSIKKFLRMGTSKTTDNFHKKSEGIYSEICTGDDAGVSGKPRLVIIHPIDINTTAVEVVKDITKTNDTVTTQTVAVVTSKPPAPPMRAHELNKPARPPPPKSAELRRKQQTVGFKINETKDNFVSNVATCAGSIKSKADNVYANLGEIRSSIAPRKPERTASMREREAQLELARKRHGCMRSENDTISICSSNGENVSAEQQQSMNPNGPHQNSNGTTHMSMSMSSNSSDRNSLTATTLVDGKPPTGSRSGTIERRKVTDTKATISSKLEIFEQRVQNNTDTGSTHSSYNSTSNESRAPSLKDSVRKITSTIDSYLKDKRDYENMYDFVKTASPPLPPARLMDLSNGQRVLPRRNNLYSDSASVASFTRSEYVPNRSYGLNNSITNIPRVISASYCGSEVGEFDIYAPYSYYGSEACAGDIGADINDSVWGIPSAIKNRVKATNRLRMRKGRSVVHKNIEDNYTAVVVANHEALAQVLDQLQQTPVIPSALRPLANAINLRFEDFSILEGGQAFVVGKKAFHYALWNTTPVTLALSADCNQLSGVGGDLNQLSGGVSGVFNPITEFCDIVPSYHLPLMPSTAVTLMQATISVLPRLQLETLQSIGTILKGKSQVLDRSNFNFRGSIPNLSASNKDSMITASSNLRIVVSVQNLSTLNEEVSNNSLEPNAQNPTSTVTKANSNGAQQKGMPAFDDVMTREVAFIMLQLVNGMKNLQSKAIEEIPLSLSNVVLSKDVDNKDSQARLCVLQGNNNDEDEPMGTLCRCAHIALTEMLPSTKITCILNDILLQERAESLSKCKAVLEFVLWGPSDVELSGSTKERELALQRWLDLERATVLHGLVRTRVELTVYDECHLMFLVRSTAKMMNDAAKIVYSYQEKMEQMPET